MLACAVSARCGTILAPVIGNLVSEKVVESHGNHVVHATAPVLRYSNVIPVAGVAFPKASLVAEKIHAEAHNHQGISNPQPLHSVEQHVAIPAIVGRDFTYARPIYYSAYPQLVAEKTVSSYGHSIRHLA